MVCSERPRGAAGALLLATLAGCGPDLAPAAATYSWEPITAAACGDATRTRSALSTRDGRAELHVCFRAPEALGELRDPVLLVPPAAMWREVRVGDRIRFSDAPEYPRTVPGMGWIWVPLDPNDAGREIHVRVRSTYPLRIGPSASFYTGDRATLTRAILRWDLPSILAGLAMLLLGTIVLPAFSPSGDRRPAALLACAAVAASGYTLHYTVVRDLVADAATTWTVAWGLGVAVLPPAIGGLAVFLLELKPRHPIVWLTRLHWCLVPVYAVRLAVGFPMRELVPEGAIALAEWASAGLDTFLRVSAAIGSLLLMGEATRHARTARPLIMGTGVLAVAGLHDVWRFLSGGDGRWATFVPFGLLAMILGLSVLVRRRYELARTTAAREVAERERLVRDLHDGMGGLLANIRALAEPGASGDPRNAERLERLAGEAVRELRTVISSATLPAPSWSELLADLRHAAVLLAEARDRPLRVLGSLGEPTARVPPALAVELRRVVQELVSNALKHSSRGEVTVEITVAKASLGIVVTDGGSDDGPSDAARGGFGLQSLAKRVAALGGKVDVRLASTGSVAGVEIPLDGTASSTL